ncbi:MAG: anaerobic ribonucleoside-triphosphate reductase activating protein [Velocimicrobium sp.]
MNYATIKKMDVANGPGLRVSLFVSGCTHYCKECFNKEAWDFKYGEPFTQTTQDTILKYLENEHIVGLSLLGGEPFEHENQKGLLPLLREVKRCYPNKTIWCYSGYDFEKDIKGRMLGEWAETKEMLSYLDILIDGEFMIEKKDLNLRFKGSTNQRIIRVKESLEANETILWEGK